MENTLGKIKNYFFPAQKVLDKAAGVNTTPEPSTDTTYLQNIIKQRMAEKNNPLVNVIKKTPPKSVPKKSKKM